MDEMLLNTEFLQNHTTLIVAMFKFIRNRQNVTKENPTDRKAHFTTLCSNIQINNLYLIIFILRIIQFLHSAYTISAQFTLMYVSFSFIICVSLKGTMHNWIEILNIKFTL